MALILPNNSFDRITVSQVEFGGNVICHTRVLLCDLYNNVHDSKVNFHPYITVMVDWK